MHREQLAVPQLTGMTEFLRLASQVTPPAPPIVWGSAWRPDPYAPGRAGRSVHGFRTVSPSAAPFVDLPQTSRQPDGSYGRR